jgi:hypothetical protein
MAYLADREDHVSFDKSTGAWTALGAASVVRKSDSRQAVVTTFRECHTPCHPERWPTLRA